MISLKDKFPDKASDFHHAYLIYGEAGELFDILEIIFYVDITGHPDLFRYETDTLTIEHARSIREQQTRRPVQAERTVFVIEANDITNEAQNALLKVFEDPAPTSIFFLILPARTSTLPTVRSRMNVIEMAKDGEEEIDPSVFLRSNPARRLEIVSPIIETKDKMKARVFLDSLERLIADKKHYIEKDASELRESIHELLEWKKTLQEPGSSVKFILEYLAMRLPTVV